MLFPATFKRYVGTAPPGGVALGSDVLPPNTAPAGTDNLIVGKPTDKNGGPVRSVEVTYQGPAGAPALTARMYFYEDSTGQWYQVGAQQTLTPGQVTFWQVITLMDAAATLVNLKVGLGPAQLAQILIVDSAMGAPNGLYRFTMGPSPNPPPTTSGSGGPVTAAEVSYDDTIVSPPLGATNVQEAIDDLKGRTAGGAFIAVPFYYNTTSPLLLQAVAAGQTISRAQVVMTTPFDDPTATVNAGSTADQTAVLTTQDVDLQQDDQYESESIVVFGAVDYFNLYIAPGTSTQGAGVLYYWIQ